MAAVSGNTSFVVVGFVLPFMEGFLRGSRGLPRRHRMVVLWACVLLGLMACILVWPAFVGVFAVEGSSVVFEELATLRYLSFVVALVAAMIAAQFSGFRVGRWLMISLTYGDKK
ncbi:hypothetical protein KX928_08905 [Roseobacter sp. YSTF-M11]|uniref:Uncharacterized protein n=1 Tax=Roseobacter insulae TaxID=2859783 RepID=A0A9X1FW05_9RHOB|nr:hypothetical protein [Roseobacter insulae]MBW4707903.1 hypothetical protein [Roseobacter insulae]